jgi:hypothetical protein
MSQHGKGNKFQRGVKYQTGKYVTVWEGGHSEIDRGIFSEWIFCHIPVKKGGCFDTELLHQPPWGLGGRNILGRFVGSGNVTVNVVNPRMLRWVDISWVSKRY